MSDLICPKCQGAMRQYERGGVTVDQCTECRGIFLDRGELERLVDAENQWHGGQRQAPPPPQQPYPNQGGYYGRQSPPPGYGRHSPPPGYGQHGGQYRRKRSFLDNLFD
jgi:Zn-finger nucleic acid-binding protein